MKHPLERQAWKRQDPEQPPKPEPFWCSDFAAVVYIVIYYVGLTILCCHAVWVRP